MVVSQKGYQIFTIFILSRCVHVYEVDHLNEFSFTLAETYSF